MYNVLTVFEHSPEVFTVVERSPEVTIEKPPRKITVHRGQVYYEFLKIFALPVDVPITVEMVQPNGGVERAVDTGRVFRDALSEIRS